MQTAVFSKLRDIETYRAKLRQKRGRRILGLDFGRSCGVAIIDFTATTPNKVQLLLGQWDLSLGRYDSGPTQFIRLKQLLLATAPDLIAFEDVKFSGSKERYVGRTSVQAILARAATAIEFLGGLKIVTTTWAEEQNTPAVGYGIGEIKKAATGKGNANKVAMIKACNEKFGTELDPADYQTTGVDNMADAAFVAYLGFEEYGAALIGEQR